MKKEFVIVLLFAAMTAGCVSSPEYLEDRYNLYSSECHLIGTNETVETIISLRPVQRIYMYDRNDNYWTAPTSLKDSHGTWRSTDCELSKLNEAEK